jgi:membrane-associated protease RseP (regulator of RpoE activity)
MRTILRSLLAGFALAATAAGAHPHPEGAGEPSPGEPSHRPGRFHHFERFLPHQARLGVQIQDMTPELREYMRAPKEHGVLVVRVNEGSPAQKAGVRVGDVITAIDGEPLDDTGELVGTVLRAEKDAKLALEVVREGKRRTLEATVQGEPPLAGDTLRWLEERGPEFRRNLEQRLRDVEARLRELEQRLRGDAAKPSDELDT